LTSVLVDTSVWIDFLRTGRGHLGSILSRELVITHPFVLGELACGALRNRKRILNDLALLPTVEAAAHDDVLRLIEERRLWRKGIGWLDAHLLTAARIGGYRLWTRDRKLAAVAQIVGVT
jgi:predicted nucleic acid-binding protein